MNDRPSPASRAPDRSLPPGQDGPSGEGIGRILGPYLILSAVVLLVLALCFALRLDTLAVGHSRTLRLIQLGLLGLLSVGFAALMARRAGSAAFDRPLAVQRPGGAVAALALLGVAGAAIIATASLQSVPLSGDEGAYLYQAELFARGRVSWTVTAIQPYVAQPYIFPVNGALISQYPPGWSAVLAAADAVRLPLVLVNPLIAGLTLVALYRFAAAQHGKETALAATAILAFSAFFLFNAASFFNGNLTALLGVLFAGSAASFLREPRAAAAVGVGLWFSAIAVVRHYDAVLFALPVAVVLLRHGTVRHWKLVPVAAAAAVPLLAALLLYYAQVTGDPFLLPQKLHNASDGLLGPNWSARRVTEILVGRFVELAEWVSPAFVVAFLLTLAWKARDGELRFFDLYGLVFLGGYWLYWADGTFRWGPRYIYPAMPFMALIVAERAVRAARNWQRHRAAFVHLVLASTVVSLLQVPFLAARARDLITQTQDIRHQARAAGLRDAVVIAVSGTGTIWRVDVGDLARNGLTLDGDVIYAHGPDLVAARNTPADIARAAEALRAHFPSRTLWRYDREPGAVHGRLTRMDAP